MWRKTYLFILLAVATSSCSAFASQQRLVTIEQRLKMACVSLQLKPGTMVADFRQEIETCRNLKAGSLIAGHSRFADNLSWETKDGLRGLAWLIKDEVVSVVVDLPKDTVVRDVIGSVGAPDYYMIEPVVSGECRAVSTLIYAKVSAWFVSELPCEEQSAFSAETGVMRAELFVAGRDASIRKMIFGMSDVDVSREQEFMSAWTNIEALKRLPIR